MIVTMEEALKVFNSLPSYLQSFYLHPTYITKDSINNRELKVCFFVIHQEHNIFYHAFYLGNVLNTELKDIQTPYGYGGPIILGSQQFKEMAIKSYLEWCQSNNIIAEFIRFHPIVNTLESYYGKITKNRETVYIDLNNSEDLLGSFSIRVRTAVKKANKNNVKVVFSKDPIFLEAFIRIYDELMIKKRAETEYFFDIEYYLGLLKNEHTYLLSAVDNNNEIIASSIFFMTNSIAEYHLSASTDTGRELSASNLMIYEFAEFAKKNKVQNLYLGGGTDNSPENSLLFFKKGFSKLSRDFYIGSFIHNPIEYSNLKNNSNNNRVLFYR